MAIPGAGAGWPTSQKATRRVGVWATRQHQGHPALRLDTPKELCTISHRGLEGSSYRRCRFGVGPRQHTRCPGETEGVALWNYVIPHFTKLLEELDLKLLQCVEAESKAERVARCLWDKYYGGPFNANCHVKVGSYGKGTATRPPSDLDMLFLLPPSEYYRVERLLGNKQSQLLQEVKKGLEGTFPRTDLRADGEVVVAPFQTYNVEVVPAFELTDGTYITAHTENNGSWRVSNPAAERQRIVSVDAISAKKATHLLKMLKAWKRECSVEMKSISLEVLACIFVEQWPFKDRSLLWYDWMVRDFFAFLRPYVNGWTLVPGTTEKIQLGNTWATKCQSAYDRSLKACAYEEHDCGRLAAEQWQKVFGEQFRFLYPAVAAVA
jgi:Second Messenger Oligonucleotide or Dinucleotide Synthetase domain